MSKSSVAAEKGEARFMLRVPAPLRDRITQRAKANGRSMNSEIIELLEMALNERSLATLLSLVLEADRLSQHREAMAAALAQADERRAVIHSEIRAIAAADSVGDVPDAVKEKAAKVLLSFGELPDDVSRNSVEEPRR